MLKATGFSALDSATGGLSLSGSYLLSGERGAGKSSLALTFLHTGIAEGENAVLITDQAPSKVLSHARNLGFDLSTAVQRRDLLIFDYPENVSEAVEQVEDHDRMLAELDELVGGRRVDRIVFDPVTPLVSVGNELDPRRCREVLRVFGALEAAALFVVDTADISHVLDDCRDRVSGIISMRRASRPGTPRLMTIEGFADMPAPTVVTYDVRPGAGLVESVGALTSEALPARRQADAVIPAPVVTAPHHGPAPSALIVEASPTRRLALRSQLERNFSVVEAGSVRTGIEYARAGRPAVIIVAEEMPSMSGSEMTRVLRQQGNTSLVVCLSNSLPRTNDQLAMLSAGVDLCLSYSTDDRILRLTILNLLSRLGVVRRQELTGETNRITRPREEGGFACTSDLRTFCGRVGRETLYARENGLPFVILTLRVPNIPEAVEELSECVAALMGLPEVVYSGPQGIACLLVEVEEGATFLREFWRHWKGAVGPVADELRFHNQDAFLHRAREFVRQRVGVYPDRKQPARVETGGSREWRTSQRETVAV